MSDVFLEHPRIYQTPFRDKYTTDLLFGDEHRVSCCEIARVFGADQCQHVFDARPLFALEIRHAHNLEIGKKIDVTRHVFQD